MDETRSNPFIQTQYGNNAFNPQRLDKRPMVSFFHLFYYYLMLETVHESVLITTLREVPAFLNRQKLLRSP